MASSSTSRRLKRGRPKTEEILAELQNVNISDPEDNRQHKCHICARRFPRTKSLSAHILTHTGEKPYACTYPGCAADFIQSGHLKTHLKRHTGEKPFSCPTAGCPTRYIHQNRKCPMHPDKKLVRDGKEKIRYPEHPTAEERLWFQEHEEKKLALSFKRQRIGSGSCRSTDSFDLNVSPSSSDKSDMGRLVIDEMYQRVPSVAEPYNFIWNKENLPSGSTTPQSVSTGYSSASPESGSTTPQFYSSASPESGSTTPQFYSSASPESGSTTSEFYSSASPESGSTTPQFYSPESGSTTPQTDYSLATPEREYNSASDNSQCSLNRIYHNSPLEMEAAETLIYMSFRKVSFSLVSACEN